MHSENDLYLWIYKITWIFLIYVLQLQFKKKTTMNHLHKTITQEFRD